MLISLDKMTGTEVREVLVNIDRVLYVEPRTRRIFFTCEDSIVVTKESMTVEGMIKITYELLKDKLNISKITFVSGDNTASQEFPIKKNIERCPVCGVALNENGVCYKCGYVK